MQASASARLVLPQGRSPTQELARYKAFLKVETHRLKIMHRAGGGGLDICHARSAMLDLLLRHLWEAAKSALSEQGKKEFPPLALVAIGGYGRSELNPRSDIDFMFLHEGQVAASKPLPYLSKIVDGLLYPLWDISLKVGHSVRSLDDCVKVANGDMQAKTSLIEARLITGDKTLFDRFQKVLLAKCVNGHEGEYVAMRLEDQAARRGRFGNSACMQEPNIKNGCGGLRDYQNLLWMTLVKYHTRSLRDLQSREFINETERRQLEGAYDFLLRVRTEMHYHGERANDVLSKSIQPAIAFNLGYGDRSPSKRIEKFMRDLYVHSRNIFLLTRTLEQRLALVPQPRKLRELPAISLRRILGGGRKAAAEQIDGFKIADGQIEPLSKTVFREQPRRLMRIFLYAQQRGLRLHPDVSQLIRNNLSQVNREFLYDEHVRETFLAILDRRGSVAPTLRAMHDSGLLGKYIPEFGRLTCLVQHEFYHQYAADEHTLMCLEQLDRVWEAKEPPHKAYGPLLQKVEQPSLLYLALLLHDVGKPEGHGHHTDVSAILARRVAKRMGLDATAAHSLCLVIENHLLLAETSQRRDLDDPAVIRKVAKKVESAENLVLLTLHSFADALATSDKLWNGFKDSLLWSLHLRTMGMLTGAPEYVRAAEAQRAKVKEEVRALLPKQVAVDELEAHFQCLPARYFQILKVEEVIEDLELAHRFLRLQVSEEDVLSPCINWHNDPDRGLNTVKVCTWDRAGLFSKIAGSFSAAGLNIWSAQIFSRSDGFVLDSFFISDARTGSIAGAEQRAKFEQLIGKALNGDTVDFAQLISRQKLTRPLYHADTGEEIPTKVKFDNEASDTRTLIEIETEDRVGLLYGISQAISELAVDIIGAKISTEKGAAFDSFYVREVDGNKVVSTDRHRAIERKLRHAIQALR